MTSKLMVAVIFVATISVGLGTYYLVLPLESSTPTSSVPERLWIPSHNGYIVGVDHIRFFTVAGVIQNNLTINVYSVNVTVTFYDDTNKTMGTNIGHADLEIIKPGQRSPFEVSLLLDSQTKVPSRYELVVLGFKTNEEPIDKLEILNPTNETIAGYFIINGEVHNTWDRKAYSVKVICTYYNSEGNIIAISHAYVSPEMEAGSKSPFKLSSSPHKINPVDYELFIIVHHYELMIIANYVLLTTLIVAFVIFVAYMRRRGW